MCLCGTGLLVLYIYDVPISYDREHLIKEWPINLIAAPNQLCFHKHSTGIWLQIPLTSSELPRSRGNKDESLLFVHAERDPGLPIMKSFPYKYNTQQIDLILFILLRFNLDYKTCVQLQDRFILALEEYNDVFWTTRMATNILSTLYQATDRWCLLHNALCTRKRQAWSPAWINIPGVWSSGSGYSTAEAGMPTSANLTRIHMTWYAIIFGWTMSV